MHMIRHFINFWKIYFKLISKDMKKWNKSGLVTIVKMQWIFQLTSSSTRSVWITSCESILYIWGWGLKILFTLEALETPLQTKESFWPPKSKYSCFLNGLLKYPTPLHMWTKNRLSVVPPIPIVGVFQGFILWSQVGFVFNDQVMC